MQVYVRNLDGRPLMPCTSAKARKLLKAGKAHVVGRVPFTIQLAWLCEGHTQDVSVGIDKGSNVTGISCVAKGALVLALELQHRRDVKEKLAGRAAHRRSRRARKWYRPPRFDNRASSKRSGRLPPSIKTNIEEVLRVVRQLPLPISRIVVEDVQVDIARLNTPDLPGSRYQEPTRLDENLRIACLMRDGYTCQHCGKGSRAGRLEAHHIVFRENGGKDSLANLLTLCAACHNGVHSGRLKLNVTGASGHLDQIAQRSMQGKAYLYTTLSACVPLTTVFGYQTASWRKQQGLAKTHTTDALCVATYDSGERVAITCENSYRISFRPRQTRRQYHDLARKGQGRVRYQVNDELAGLRKGDIVRVKGRWIKQVNSIYSATAKSQGRVAFVRVKGEPSSALVKDCIVLERGRTVRWEQMP